MSIGSNLGQREERVLAAANRIDAEGLLKVSALSSLYESEPVGCPQQPPFVNAVAEVRSLLNPYDLLKRIKEIEKIMGRRGGHNQPREIDIDIVTLGSWVVEETDLVLPHPRYRRRAFVLVPLREVAPGFRCPLTGRTVGEMLADVGEEGVWRVSSRRILLVRTVGESGVC